MFAMQDCFLSSHTGADSRCPNDWLSKYNHCYKIFDDQKNWNDAEMFCRKQKPGCHLASIHSSEESADVAKYISDYIKTGKSVWIGLKDPKKKDRWEWTDRSRTNYLAWAPGEPSYTGDYDFCVNLKNRSKYRKWDDSDCNRLHPFLCQCP
ncbi:C-type lectin mannose-binding isoform-like [Crotalus tigris]|uniref:C-type lectin mannose-binding isoform-like n=1 Tax=Crotalus tigris TaxID=88082 RepID=UPI00192F16F0|nr:C-type lectin mannose-binding isoform-like [Crotalus tigris]